MLSSQMVEVGVFSFTDAIVEIDSRVVVRSGGVNVATTRSFGVLTKLAAYVNAFPILKKFVSTFRPDVVHSMYASSYGLLGALLKHKPYYVSAWGSDVFAFPRKNI